MQLESIDDESDGVGGNVAWQIDAWSYRDVKRVQFIGSHQATAFLKKNSTLAVILAGKGMGKTRILQRKSELVREATEEKALFFPERELVEKLNALPIDLSDDAVKLLGSPGQWKILWATAIAVVVLYRARRDPFSASVARMFGVSAELSKSPEFRRPLTVGAVLFILLKVKPASYTRFYAVELAPSLERLDHNCNVFIDGVDEAFNKHSGETLLRFVSSASTTKEEVSEGESSEEESSEEGVSQEGVLSANIWVNSQLGLLSAIRDLHHASRRLRVYATMRPEAVDTNCSSLAEQERSLCQELCWDKRQVEEMFLANIDATTVDELSHQTASDPYERFVKLTHIPLPTSLNAAGRIKPERLFDFLYRHTFGRPRDLLLMGLDLCKLAIADRTVSNVRDRVRARAVLLLQQYKRDMRPYWDRRCDDLLRLLDSNVISGGKASQIYKRLHTIVPEVDHPFSYYLNRGLIGWQVRDEESGQCRIEFRPVGTYANAEPISLAMSQWYFLHPCLSESIRGRNAGFRFDRRQLVGIGNNVTIGPDRDALHIQPFNDKGFIVEFDGTWVNHLSSPNRNIVTPLFVALVCAVSHAGRGEVPVARLREEAERLAGAGLIEGQWGGLDIGNYIETHFGNAESPSGEAIRIMEDMNLALALALTARQELDEANGGAAGDLVTWNGGKISFTLCPPDKIDVQAVIRQVM